MSLEPLCLNSLVLYKQNPAIVRNIQAKKLQIVDSEGGLHSVRPKDVTLLHSGPINNLSNLKSPSGDFKTAWELLAGETVSLKELAELIFSEFSVETAWATWQLVADGLYFKGDPEAVKVQTIEEVEKEKEIRTAKEAEQEAWEAFLVRLSNGEVTSDDWRYLQDLVALAENQRNKSQVLRAIGQAETPENAHAVLLKSGFWDIFHNPYPARAGLPTSPPNISLPEMPLDERQDLTHLTAWAIDDEGSNDPDDALSWDGERIWAHIADVAALIPPDSPADITARSRAANLYLPEGTVTMLPELATDQLALGLTEISPALSFGMHVDEVGQISSLEITPSLVRVTRLSYLEAEALLSEPPLAQLLVLADRFQKRRAENGAIEINLPELKIRVMDNKVILKPILPLRSREIVREAMLMVGEAVAHFALDNGLALPFTMQDAPVEELPVGDTLSAMFATRRLMRPSQQKSQPGAHAGLGLGIYVQATSPLRRYLDLVVHQQLRAFLAGGQVLDPELVLERIGAADAVSGDVRRTERLANQHWTLVYLLQNPSWEGEGYVIEIKGRRQTVLLPELGLETTIYHPHELPLDAKVQLKVRDVDLPRLEARFQPI